MPYTQMFGLTKVNMYAYTALYISILLINSMDIYQKFQFNGFVYYGKIDDYLSHHP